MRPFGLRVKLPLAHMSTTDGGGFRSRFFKLYAAAHWCGGFKMYTYLQRPFILLVSFKKIIVNLLDNTKCM